MFQAKLADFITIQVKIVEGGCEVLLLDFFLNQLLENLFLKKKKQKKKSSSRMSAQGEAGAKGLTVASRDTRPTLAANPRGI